MECPRCRLLNPPEAIRCDCGYNFKTGEMQASIVTHTASATKSDEPIGDYFSFRIMISTSLIKIVHILGMIVITIISIVLLLQSFKGGEIQERPFFLGVGVLLLGNIVWRILCEGAILTFSIHEMLGSIEKELKRQSQ